MGVLSDVIALKQFPFFVYLFGRVPVPIFSFLVHTSLSPFVLQPLAFRPPFTTH